MLMLLLTNGGWMFCHCYVLYFTSSVHLNPPADNGPEGGNTSMGQSLLAAEFLQLLLVALPAAGDAVVAAAAAVAGVVGVAVAAETRNGLT